MSPSPNTVKSLAERRVRRQKIFIAVGSVVLLAVLGFELPKIMGGKGGHSAAPPAATTVSGASAGAGGAAPVPAGALPGTDHVVVQRDSNQLISFGLFKSKDPFVPQLTTTVATAPSAPPAPAPADTTATTSTEPTPPVLVPPVGPPSSTTPSSPSGPSAVPGSATPTPAPPPVPTAALIATNGVCEQVPVKGTFPATENIFRLASIAKDGKSVQVGIVGGSFDSGQPTATLKLGDKLTLVNTADGTRYVIELKSKCVGLPAEQSGTQTTAPPQPAPTTPVSPAPVPAPTTTATTTTTDTVTTPIVTDSLDSTTPSS